MFHVMYLKGLCERRNWPQPVYRCQKTPTGFVCTARVNSRDFSTEAEYTNPNLAMDAVACQAYVYCRDFSRNAEQTPNRAGSMQGLPTAIGTGRHAAAAKGSRAYTTSDSRRFSSSDSGSERRSSTGSSGSNTACPCGQPLTRAFDRCQTCLRREKMY